MNKHSNLLWITGIALGWLLDLLFWKQPFGINFAIFSLLCLTGGFVILYVNRQQPARGTLWLLPLILLFVTITTLRAEPMTLFLAILLTLFLMFTLTNTFPGWALAAIRSRGLRECIFQSGWQCDRPPFDI